MEEIIKDSLYYFAGMALFLPVSAAVIYGIGGVYSTGKTTSQKIRGNQEPFCDLYKKNFTNFLEFPKKEPRQKESDLENMQ